MKRLILAAVLLFSSFSYAGWVEDNYVVDVISVSTKTIGAQNARITIPQAGSGIRNCITDISIGSNLVLNFNILDGALTAPTTLYAIAVSSGLPYEEQWFPSPLCSAPNSTMTIVATNYLGVTPTPAVTMTYTINVQGYTRNRP